MALELIEIKDFPRTTSVTGAGDELIVVSKADGKTYGIKTSDFKAFLGTVQTITPRPIAPTDPAPTLDGVYIPTTNGTYANAGGLTLDFSEGGADYGMMTQFIKNGSVWVKSYYPLPMQDVSGLATKDELEIEVNSIFSFINGSGTIDYKFKPILTEGYLINVNGNYTATTSIWWASEQFIPLNGATSVVYSGRVGESGTKIAFYSNANAASMVEAYPQTSESKTLFETPTPSGAKYLRVTCRDVGLVNFYLILKGYKFEVESGTENPLFDFRITGAGIVYENETIKEANIIWNDNSTGRVVYSDWDEDNATYKSFVATSVENGKQITQPSVTFNSDGQITNYPNFIITDI